MKTLIRLSLSALCALLVCGCWNGRVLFAFEQPFWDSLGDDLPTRLALAKQSIPRGYVPRLLLAHPPDDPLARLARELATGGYRTAVVGPLVSSQWRDFATRFSHTRFILIGAEDTDLPPNAVVIRYDRTAAFRSAGFAAGVSVREEGGGGGVSALSGRIGILLSFDPVLTDEETGAFSSGVAEALDGGQPALRTLSSPLDRGAVKAAIEQMRQAGVEIILLGTGSFDPWCLEVMAGAGGSAVVADWAASRAFPKQVFLSVEEDIPHGIGRALAARAAGPGAVSGPVYIIRGAARHLPAAAMSRMEMK